ncbi:hypothetical protein IV454_18360 [Massilia antarctica]|uniref:Uncharacterized protein n=1 Tax=Massilia antarctica TaxID=2765360 RepID=A0AA48W662_9BURK|nr:hypothetical protein [Massilia antarctica]QPI47561.1 hypothetical protein IV454_18360 [Massilia antarctica]
MVELHCLPCPRRNLLGEVGADYDSSDAGLPVSTLLYRALRKACVLGGFSLFFVRIARSCAFAATEAPPIVGSTATHAAARARPWQPSPGDFIRRAWHFTMQNGAAIKRAKLLPFGEISFRIAGFDFQVIDLKRI